MSKIKFKRSILRSTTFLIQRGYIYQPFEGETSDVIPFRKQPVDEIQITISFQLMQNFIPPVRRFDIRLSRKYLPNFPYEDRRYLPLVTNLFNLTRSHYQVDIFPSGKFLWDFVDEESLMKQLSHAESVLIEYGIPWLEDPASNMDWLRQKS